MDGWMDPSVVSLCHPWFTTTNLPYSCSYSEIWATALCGTTGIQKTGPNVVKLKLKWKNAICMSRYPYRSAANFAGVRAITVWGIIGHATPDLRLHYFESFWHQMMCWTVGQCWSRTKYIYIYTSNLYLQQKNGWNHLERPPMTFGVKSLPQRTVTQSWRTKPRANKHDETSNWWGRRRLELQKMMAL